MLIFSNNCASGHLYKQLGIKYNQPFPFGHFCWNEFENEDEKNILNGYYNFISEYDKVNLSDFNVEKSKELKVLLFDFGNFKFRFSHYLFEIGHKMTLKENGIDLGGDDAMNYTYDCFIRRFNRMPNEEPIFILHLNKSYPDTEETIKRFINLNRKMIIICRHKVNFEYAKKYETEKIIVLANFNDNVKKAISSNINAIKTYIASK